MLIHAHKTGVDTLPFGVKPKAKKKSKQKDAKLDALEEIDGKDRKEKN